MIRWIWAQVKRLVARLARPGRRGKPDDGPPEDIYPLY